MKKILIRAVFVTALGVCLLLNAACENYRAASPETTVPETAAAETTAVTETTATPTAVPTVTVSPTAAETTAKKIPVEPIDTTIRTDLPAPVLYTVTALTSTGKTAVWADETRKTASRYLLAGDLVTVVAIVGRESRPYALLDTGEYVLLASLEAVPVATATPAATVTPKPTKAPTKTPSATTSTTAAPTDPPAPPPATSPAYYPNAENIRNLIVGSLQAQGRWFPDATATGGGSANVPVDYFLDDQEFANYYLGKFKPEYNNAGVSVSVTIVKAPNEWSSSCDYVLFSSTDCPMSTA